MSDKGAQTRDEFLNEVERRCGVNIEVDDNSGKTYVYAYADRGERIGFEFFSMDPSLLDVNAVAIAIGALKAVANKGVGLVSVS